jgi:two-component system CheB/CheR fusion protein
MPRKRPAEPAADAPPSSASADRSVGARTAPFPIVGIGASAGGVEAFTELLSALPPNTGMAFVLLLHLPIGHESLLSEILGRVCRMPLAEVRDRVVIEPNHVYVLGAASDLDIDGKSLVLVERPAPGQHRPIDRFFRGLATHHANCAIGVVLSGTGSDGSTGIQEIKAAGGITFAQDDTAQQASMPRSAIETGTVDFVLSPGDIAHELARIASHPLVSAPYEPDDMPFDLGPLLEVLHNSIGVDFADYKPNTLYRRIARRIVLHKLDSVTDYLTLLKSDAAEAHALYQDILINVTSFFRNPDAFEALKTEVFPKITQSRSRHDPVRVWTLACSTGEEAYSIAMAYAEFLEESGLSVPLQLFATDLNEAGIDRARLGLYPKSVAEQVGPERLRRFFVQVDGSYRIAKPIRDVCIFARHNVLTDPPFSRIDLVSCRNMLIYLGQELQQKVISILHYALRPAGFLWLGNSETIGSHRDLFELVETKSKIYAKHGALDHLPIGAVSTPRTPLAAFRSAVRLPEPPPVLRDTHREAERLLLARYAPPSVLVRSDLEILQYRGNTSPFLAPAPGKASLNLLKMLREGLVMGVRSALTQARASETPVRHEDLWIAVDGRERRVAIEVIPVRSGGDRAELFMVVFEETPIFEPAADAPSPTAAATGTLSEETAKLKQELAATREYLQSVIEQQEVANEELQSANEEVQSTNEELQSINEELETSKEEVQSTNEELATVNDELHARNVELSQINNDVINLLSSVQIAIVMLGANLRIRRYTPMAEKLLNLIPSDVGRPLSDIKLKLDVPDIDKLVADTIDSMTGHEREVRDEQGHWYLLRIRPYRTLEQRLEGAVVMLVDVDSLKQSEEMLRQQTELLNQAHEPIIMWELDGAIDFWNKSAEETYGYSREEALGRRSHELLLTSPAYESFAGELRERGYWSGELIHTRRDGQKIIVESRMVVVTDTQGRQRVVETHRSIIERRESERLRRLADDLVTADRHKDEFLAMLAHELRNPLAPLRNAVTLLKSPKADAANNARVLDIMDRQISNMARLIDDLLDVSRITLSQIELRTELLDVGAFAKAAVEQNESHFASREQSLHLSLPAKPLQVNADPVRLEQIVGNLLNNASKYTQPGGNIRLTVTTSGDDGKNAKHALIRVEDDGAGIAPDDLPHVFDLFMRAARSIDQQYGGLGVGLTLVKRLVEMHGGAVRAESEGLGKGSRFTVCLPALPPQADSPPAVIDSGNEGPSARRILIVDDSVDNVDTLAMALRTGPHEVRTAESGARALEIAAQFRPEFVFIDIGMPGMDGYELARRLREKETTASARLIALSGYGHAAARDSASDAGFAEYLVKPVDPRKILSLIES